MCFGRWKNLRRWWRRAWNLWHLKYRFRWRCDILSSSFLFSIESKRETIILAFTNGSVFGGSVYDCEIQMSLLTCEIELSFRRVDSSGCGILMGEHLQCCLLIRVLVDNFKAELPFILRSMDLTKRELKKLPRSIFGGRLSETSNHIRVRRYLNSTYRRVTPWNIIEWHDAFVNFGYCHCWILAFQSSLIIEI